MPLHDRLIRQLAKFGFSEAALPQGLSHWKQFLSRVNNSYNEFDQDRYLIERSQEISSKEMLELYSRLEEAQSLAQLGSWSYNIMTGKIIWSKETYALFGRELTLNSPSYEEYLQYVHPEDRDAIISAVNAAIGEGVDYELEQRIYADGGRLRWLYAKGRVIRDPDTQKPIMLTGTALDITQRKADELQLEILNKQLISSSRRVGMSEVATSVLHNIGNVLNSINVACNLLHEQLKKSQISNIKKVFDVLRNNENTDKNFLSSQKGRKLIEFLELLSKDLTAEQNFFLQELNTMLQQVDVIKETVNMQQSLSGTLGIVEPVEVNELVKDGLKINQLLSERINVNIKVDFCKSKTVCTDRIKLLQVIVNLIKNALESCEACFLEEKEIHIKTSMHKNQYLIEISDNGVGVIRENIAKIFSYGFTTKKDGHGFGLHISALSIKELGGSLQVFSEGENKGARFVITLPCNPTAPKYL